MRDKLGDKVRVQYILKAIIWQIVTTDIPVLKSQMEQMLTELPH